MSDEIKSILSQLRAGLSAAYGTRLKGIYLYGSAARGEAGHDSDIDVLVVLDSVERYGEELKATSELVSVLSLDSGRSISRVFLSATEWEAGDSPFLVNVREEAIAA